MYSAVPVAHYKVDIYKESPMLIAGSAGKPTILRPRDL